jgi:LuxR family maltose regulon positive regulatory protein
MSAPLLTTKLYVPPVRAKLVPRPRLTKKLDAGLDQKLTLVSAAAGFGKTTLVAEWLREVERPTTWLSLDEGDNDTGQFVTYLIAALQTIDESIGRVAKGLLTTPQLPPIQSLVTLIVNDIAALPQPFVLVLDEYDAIHAEAIHEAVAFLIEHLPSTMHLILLTRQDPPVHLSRLRVRHQVAEISEDDLRFTADEAGDFLRQVLGLDLDPNVIDALQVRTEGWIAGLQLAALSIEGRPSDRVAEFAARFGGSHRHVIDYLADEVLARQSAEIRSFLCQTSILDRLTASLCDVVTGRSDSRELLSELDRSNLFLIPLDDEREWYRYHRLFADFLRAESGAADQAELHARASRWFAAHNLMPEAVRHSLASRDVAEAARVIALASTEAFRSGSFATLQGWLDALPDETVRGNGDLATFRGYVLFFAGQPTQATAYVEAAERAMAIDATPSSRGRLLSLRAHLAISTGALDASARFSRDALDLLDAGDTTIRSLVLNLLGQVMEAKGDVVAAAKIYREGAPTDWRGGEQIGALVILTNLVFALNELGRRREAVATCRRLANEDANPPRPLDPVTQGLVLAWSLLSYEANQLEQAREQATRAIDLAEKANITDGVLLGRLVLGRVHLACGELDMARKVAQKGRDYTAGLDVYKGKVEWFAALEAQVSLVEGDLAAVARWAEGAGFSPTDTPHPWDEITYFMYVRLLIAQNRLEDAQQLLDRMERSASQGERRRKLITIALLQALVNLSAGHPKWAIARLANALNLAAPEGYRRAFLDEGTAIVDLLPQVRHLAPGFVAEILSAATAGGTDQAAARSTALVEPLSERERDVLRLMAAGRSNPEIAELLYLSPNTVKWHAKNLFGKLHVSNRVEAVTRAQELELL